MAAARADQKPKSEESTAPNLLLAVVMILAEAGVFCNGRLSSQDIEADLKQGSTLKDELRKYNPDLSATKILQKPVGQVY